LFEYQASHYVCDQKLLTNVFSTSGSELLKKKVKAVLQHQMTTYGRWFFS